MMFGTLTLDKFVCGYHILCREEGPGWMGGLSILALPNVTVNQLHIDRYIHVFVGCRRNTCEIYCR